MFYFQIPQKWNAEYISESTQIDLHIEDDTAPVISVFEFEADDTYSLKDKNVQLSIKENISNTLKNNIDDLKCESCEVVSIKIGNTTNDGLEIEFSGTMSGKRVEYVSKIFYVYKT